MEKHECCIGTYNTNFDGCFILTLGTMIDFIDYMCEGVPTIINISMSREQFKNEIMEQRKKHTKEILHNINGEFTKFTYCPICGKKLDWEQIEKECICRCRQNGS